MFTAHLSTAPGVNWWKSAALAVMKSAGRLNWNGPPRAKVRKNDRMKAYIITDCRQWNDFVAASVCCNITQSYEWGELAPHLGAEALRIGVVDEDGQLCAAMLILITSAPVLRRTYFYAPRGPVIDDPDSPAMTVLLNFVKAEARKRGAFMLKIEPSVPEGDQQWLATLKKPAFRPNLSATYIRTEWALDI